MPASLTTRPADYARHRSAYVLEADLLERHREPEAGQPAEQGGIDDLQLVSRQGLSQALVDAVAEGQVVGRVARKVEPVGIGEHALVPVRRGEQQEQALAAPSRR
jgi:hypothetical protein